MCLYDVVEACSKVPFYHVFGGSVGFRVVSGVLGWASMILTTDVWRVRVGVL